MERREEGKDQKLSVRRTMKGKKTIKAEINKAKKNNEEQKGEKERNDKNKPENDLKR